MKFIKVEDFFIKKIKKSKNNELNLLENIKIHSIFDNSLLKSINLDIFIQEAFRYVKQKKNEFEIKAILKRKSQKYLVK